MELYLHYMPFWACDKLGFYPDHTLQLQPIMFLCKLNNHAKISALLLIYSGLPLSLFPQLIHKEMSLLTESCMLDEDGDLQ